MKSLLTLALLLLASRLSAQQLFPTGFEGCNTDAFALEKDSALTDIPLKKMEKIIMKKIMHKNMTGHFMLQILVEPDGSSCLLSMENSTSLPDADFAYLRNDIAQHLHWKKPREKVSVIFSFSIKNGRAVIQRWGFDMKRGLHQIDHSSR